MGDTRLPRPFVVFSAAVYCAGIAAFILTLSSDPPLLNTQSLLIGAAILVSEFYLLQLKSYSVSLSMPLILTAMVSGGPGLAMIAAALASVSPEDVRSRRPTSLLIFNFGQLALSSAVAAWVYIWSGGQVLAGGSVTPLSAANTPGTLAAVLAAAASFNAMNMLLMSLGVSLGRGMRFMTVLRDLAGPLPTQLALALVGLLMAQVLAINPVGFPLFLFPLFLARQVYQRYANLRDAYLDTVRSLIGALEAKDPYTRGHSERVADYAVQLAQLMKMDDKAIDRVHQAALLHDIGKLVMPSSILTKPSSLSDAEYAAMKQHPVTGEAIVLRIPALKRLEGLVLCHHEKLDGSGYPRGISRSAIPLLARILAVADAYDAMTTHRAYRSALSHSEAIEELSRCAGTQFDADVVTAFIDGQIGARRDAVRRVAVDGSPSVAEAGA